MTDEIKIGDVVELKSSSPQMTVDKIEVPHMSGSDRKWAMCSWFNGPEPRRNSYPLSSLKKVQAEAR